MKKYFKMLSLLACCIYCSCDNNSTPNIEIPESDIAEEITGEWVYDHPEEEAWQSMKFVIEGAFFCYSDDKDNWTDKLKEINKGNYGVKGMVVSAANGTTYLDMTVLEINGYQFTTRFHESSLQLTFHKVVMRTHLNFGESVTPPYAELVDATIIGYKSHDESIAIVNSATGEITAVANNGRTYVDIVTSSGTAVIKVMVGNVDDGDEAEISPITKKTVTPVKPILNLPQAILGKWIWDVSYWESINFLENGKVYYSNIDAARGIYNENAPGEYTIDPLTNRLTLTVLPTGGTQMTIVMAMTAISKYSFTAKLYLSDGQSTGTYTYAKQIGAIELKGNETLLPKYNTLVETGTVINKFRSHNSKIAEVNSETGEITARMGGKTYIDIITDDGTAVLEVNVKSLMQYNYEDFIGVNKQTITNTFDHVYTTDGDDMIYNYRKGSVAEEEGVVKDANWDQILFRFDSSTGKVKAMSLLAKKDVWFTPEEMVQYLSQRFYVYEKGSEDNFKAFINAESLEDATIGITWDMLNGILAYVEIPHNAETSVLDYGGDLGKTREEIKSLMNGYSLLSETDERIGYTIGSEYLRMANFSFKASSGIKDTVQEVVLYLNTGIDPNFVRSEIEKTYKYSDGVEGSYLNYYSEDMKIRVLYQISSNLLQFIQK